MEVPSPGLMKTPDRSRTPGFLCQEGVQFLLTRGFLYQGVVQFLLVGIQTTFGTPQKNGTGLFILGQNELT